MNDRIRTIDVLRGLTMFLMLFVNDIWSLTGIPEWLGHTSAEVDGMGFSDVIYPMFLFIVGLSIPLAINKRMERKESMGGILYHILTRTAALLVMGFFMVNYSFINAEVMWMNKNVWQILMATGILLIWLDYRSIAKIPTRYARVLVILGIVLLLYLAWIFRGGTVGNIIWMKPHWWGILGLIGWAYLLNSLLYLLSKKSILRLLAIFVLLLFMNVQENSLFESLPRFKLVVSASNHVLVMGGVLCTMLYLRFKVAGKPIVLFLGLVSITALAFIWYGSLLRPVFPISKILATPSWTAICMGISLSAYVVLYVVVERFGFDRWARPIRPAGTSTLTCYLMPYFLYPVLALVGIQWATFLSHGFLGILKSLSFSLIIILIVGGMEKRNMHLKI